MSIRDSAIFQLAYWYGLRISEVGLIQLEHFNLEEKRIFITRIKGGISNKYLIRDDVIKLVKRWIVLRGKEEGPLFPSRKTKLGVLLDGTVVKKRRGISKRQLDLLFKTYAEKAGIPENHRNFHTLRHTCAVNMVDADVPMKQIQDWLGHTSIKSTMIYAQVSTAKREKTAAKFYASMKGTSVPVTVMGEVPYVPDPNAKPHKIDWKKNKVRPQDVAEFWKD